MNISAWTIYWFIKLDAIINIMSSLGGISVGACVIAVSAIFVCVMCKENTTRGYGDSEETVKESKEQLSQYIKYWTKIFKRLIDLPFIFIILSHMLPTTKEMATIYVIPKIANSNFVNETLPAEMKDIYGMAKQWMKETLKTSDVKDEQSKTEPVKVEPEQKK
jgi:gas vesicle protein